MHQVGSCAQDELRVSEDPPTFSSGAIIRSKLKLVRCFNVLRPKQIKSNTNQMQENEVVREQMLQHFSYRVFVPDSVETTFETAFPLSLVEGRNKKKIRNNDRTVVSMRIQQLCRSSALERTQSNQKKKHSRNKPSAMKVVMLGLCRGGADPPDPTGPGGMRFAPFI